MQKKNWREITHKWSKGVSRKRNMEILYFRCGPGSVVGIATGYGLDGPGIESRWWRDYPHLSRPAWVPHSLLYNGYRVFSRSKERPGCDAEPSPLLVSWSWKSRAIPLLPLWAVRPVQKLSACTRVTFTFTLPVLWLTLYLIKMNYIVHTE